MTCNAALFLSKTPDSNLKLYSKLQISNSKLQISTSNLDDRGKPRMWLAAVADFLPAIYSKITGELAQQYNSSIESMLLLLILSNVVPLERYLGRKGFEAGGIQQN